MSEETNRTWAPYGWMLCSCFSFAWMSEFAHALGPTCDWRLVALARGCLAFLFAITLARASGARLVLWKPGILWLRSGAGSMSLLCTFFALTRLPASEVLTLTNTFPIWVAILSWPLLQVRPALSVWVAAACGVLGIVLIQQPHFESSPDAGLAVGLALLSALTSAVAMLGLHRLQGIAPWAIVAHFSGVATLVVLLTCCFGPPVPAEQLFDPRHLLLLLGVGISATAGQMCLTRAFTAGPPARVSIVGLTQILFALGLDMLFETARLNAATLAGIGLVMAPTAWMMSGRTGE